MAFAKCATRNNLYPQILFNWNPFLPACPSRENWLVIREITPKSVGAAREPPLPPLLYFGLPEEIKSSAAWHEFESRHLPENLLHLLQIHIIPEHQLCHHPAATAIQPALINAETWAKNETYSTKSLVEHPYCSIFVYGYIVFHWIPILQCR